MKRLVITRHGKSKWTDYDYDWQRELTSKGRKRNKMLGKYLKENDIIPDLIVSSFAYRALNTAKIIAKEVGYDKKKINIRKEIYHADIEMMLNLIYSLDNDADTVFLFGHNPTFTFLVNYFAKEKISHLQTTGSFGVSFKTKKWEKIETAERKDLFLVVPR
jgi:phosphohistidine phosphatase